MKRLRRLLPGRHQTRTPFLHRLSVCRMEAAPDDREVAFDVQGQRPWPGWNMLELDVESDGMHAVATIIIETRRGRREVGLPVRPGKTAKRLVFLPMGVTRLSMRVLNSHGGFRVTRMRWVWLTPWFARDRLSRHLASTHADYKGLHVPQVMRALHRESVAQGSTWHRVASRAYEQTFDRACARHDYAQWVRTCEPRRDVTAQATGGGSVSERPLLSVLMPLGDELRRVGLAGLEASLRSLQAQHYGRWELCVVVSPALEAALVAALNQRLAEVSRARLITGHGSSQASLGHQAFVECSGDGVLMLSPGDRLAEEALQRVVEVWNRKPAVQLFYADEDDINDQGERCRPRFKPGWNPDLLLASSYIGRLAVYKRRLVWRLDVYRDIGRDCRAPLDAEALDHAMALRFLAWHAQRDSRAPMAVQHLPRVLYHRHIAHREAQAAQPNHAVALVEDLLGVIGGRSGACVEPGLLPHSTHVRWPLPDPAPLVSLLVPTRDGVEILQPCVDAILERTDYRHFELLILDNQSTCTDTLAYMDEVARRDPRVRVLRWDHPFNYSAINNFGAAHAKGSIIGLVNNDVEPIAPAWLGEMVRQVCRPEIGCVGAKLYYPNDTLQHGGVILGLGGIAGHAHRFFPSRENGYCGRLKLVQNLSAVTAACLLLRRDVFEAVGGLNEPDLAVAYNDVDLCLKVREAGYRNLWTPYAELYHHESISRGADDTPEKQARWLREKDYMRRTWGQALDNDPAYNPNLTLVHEDFSLR